MSDKDSFDRFESDLAAWLRGRAPSEAPDRVLDGALQRATRESQRHGWFGRRAASLGASIVRAAAVAAVLIGIVVIGFQVISPPTTPGESAAPIPSPLPSASTGASPSSDPLAGCPEPPYTFISVTGVAEEDRAACFGDQEMVITGWVLRLTEPPPPCAQPVPKEVAWLNCQINQQPLAFGLVPPGPYQPISRLLWMAADPDGPLGPVVLGGESEQALRTNTWVEVTGHFNDPLAQQCGSSAGDSVRERCAGTFVLSAVTELDASWPQEALVSAECVTQPLDLLTLIFQTAPADCYGSAPITVVAQINGVGAIDGPCLFTEPAWLGCGSWISLDYARDPVASGSVVLASARGGAPAPVADAVPSGGFSISLFAAIDPESGIAWDQFIGTVVQVTGHFDDPAAASCLIEGLSPEEAVQSCRNLFVVTELLPIQ